MTRLPYLDAGVVAATPYRTAADALEAALLAGDSGEHDPLRSIVDVPCGQVLFMPSSGRAFAGVKLVTIAPDNPAHDLPRIQGVYVLMTADTLTPVATMDAAALTTLRTPAVSAVAARHLAKDDASRLVVFGTGPQAQGHVDALAAERPIVHVGVVGRRADAVARLVEHAERLGLAGYAATPGDIANADVVVAATTSREPVVTGADLAEGALVVAVGAHEPDWREVDTATVARSHVVVEDRAAAGTEAGDLVLAAAELGRDVEVAGDLRDLVRGLDLDPARTRLFKSVGMAWEDLVVAAAVHERWVAGT